MTLAVWILAQWDDIGGVVWLLAQWNDIGNVDASKMG
jgi:hypothetical protein